MPQKIIIAEQERIAALFTDDRVDKLIVAQGRYQIGDVYLGTIENVLPGIDAAFVNIGASEKNGFIHVTDLGPLKLQKNASSITELLEPRQKVLVQVMKEPTGNKGPRLTGNISLPGRYLVLQPNGQGVNISRLINTENERNRLRALGVLIKPPGTGLTIRSEAKQIAEELIIEDLENLLKKWELIQQASERANPPTLLNRDEDFIHRVLRDHINSELSKVIVDSNAGQERVKRFLAQDYSNVIVECHNEPNNLIEHFKIDTAILNALKPRVDLLSGGYIIIEPTEALTVIDVNSGSFTRSSNSRETVLWTNCEAAVEIARQLKLRNIGGVIVIDFIDMESRRDQLQLLEYFTSAIKDDSSRPQIAQLTELGLVELTRKRQGQNIYELFSKECSHCSGLGHIAKMPEKKEMHSSVLNNTNADNISKENEINSNNQINNIPGEKGESKTKVLSQELNIEEANASQEIEKVSIKMDAEEEYVYSYLGLSPTLLLDKETTNDNLLVHVIRKNEENDDLLKQEEVTEVITTNTRKKAKESIQDLSIETELIDNQVEAIQEISNKKENNLEVNQIDSTESDQQAPEEIEDPRRRRRRSSASS
ncbi:Rne/Rng family ribonuclease [Prochlorococcus marinus]|uniref:Rne/Rng family ribonuclease n=1 Tax=Prochlorococcus marinus TaxID=1219 RepID=UPI0022B4C0AD|nr:Rne/Rng family ribonuclease [Prochlorococcus marinus]